MIENLDELKTLINKNEKTKIKLKVIAGAKTESIDFSEEFIKLKISQKPVEGKANKAIIEYLSDLLKLPKSKINILNGHKSSIKTIELG